MCIYRTTILMPQLRNFIGLSSLNCAHAQHFPANEMCCCLSPPISAQISSPDLEQEQEQESSAVDRGQEL